MQGILTPESPSNLWCLAIAFKAGFLSLLFNHLHCSAMNFAFVHVGCASLREGGGGEHLPGPGDFPEQKGGEGTGTQPGRAKRRSRRICIGSGKHFLPYSALR